MSITTAESETEVHRPIRLSQAPDGARVRVHATELECADCDLLNALGLTDRCAVRVCKVGNPCIVQVRSTRIGLSMHIAERILVIADDDSDRS